MKFLCLIAAEKVMEQMPPADAERHFHEYAEFTESIKASGHFIEANRLKPALTAATVRVRNGKVSTTDGPFAETKEQFGGYYVIQAEDLREAIQVASRIPGARFGCVEVRPIADDPQTLALGFDGEQGKARCCRRDATCSADRTLPFPDMSTITVGTDASIDAISP